MARLRTQQRLAIAYTGHGHSTVGAIADNPLAPLGPRPESNTLRLKRCGKWIGSLSCGCERGKRTNSASLCFVTPSHQFPTGAVLPLTHRVALLEWANRNHAAIIEDDYDGEFHYGGRPLESLQGLDGEGRVIYVGTFSRTVFPALRLGYLVVPKSLITAFTGAKWLNDQHSAILEQQTLAEFITTGAYERHLRRVRRRNAVRLRALLDTIDLHMRDAVDVTGHSAGAHIAVWPRQRVDERSVIARAAELGVGIYGMSQYFLIQPQRTGFLLGYSRMNIREIREGIRRLSRVF